VQKEERLKNAQGKKEEAEIGEGSSVLKKEEVIGNRS